MERRRPRSGLRGELRHGLRHLASRALLLRSEDQVPPSTYLELVRSGGLAVDEGHVPSIEKLLTRVWAWSPSCIVCDPYRSAELNQVVGGRVRIVREAGAVRNQPRTSWR